MTDLLLAFILFSSFLACVSFIAVLILWHRKDKEDGDKIIRKIDTEFKMKEEQVVKEVARVFPTLKKRRKR